MTHVLLTLALLALFGAFHLRAVRLRAERPWSGDVQTGIFDGLDAEIVALLAADQSARTSEPWAMPLAA